jgi:hypothetical protein
MISVYNNAVALVFTINKNFPKEEYSVICDEEYVEEDVEKGYSDATHLRHGILYAWNIICDGGVTLYAMR